MCRAARVPQRAANDGRERAATVTRSAEQVQRQKTLGLITGLQIGNWLVVRAGSNRRPSAFRRGVGPVDALSASVGGRRRSLLLAVGC